MSSRNTKNYTYQNPDEIDSNTNRNIGHLPPVGQNMMNITEGYNQRYQDREYGPPVGQIDNPRYSTRYRAGRVDEEDVPPVGQTQNNRYTAKRSAPPVGQGDYDEDFDPEYFDNGDIPPEIMQKIYDVQKYMDERRNAARNEAIPQLIKEQETRARQQNSARQRNSSPQRMPIDNTPLPPVGQTGQNERVPFYNYPPRVGQSVSGYRPANADPRISINGMPSVQENLRNNSEYEDEYEDNHYYEPLYDESYSPYLAGGRNSNRRSNR